MRFHWEEVSLFCLGKVDANVVVMDCGGVVLLRHSDSLWFMQSGKFAALR